MAGGYFDLDTSFEACYPPPVVSSSITHDTTEGYRNEELKERPSLCRIPSWQEAE